MTISPVLPSGNRVPQQPRFQANVANSMPIAQPQSANASQVKFGGNVPVTVQKTEPMTLDQVISKLPKSVGVALQRGIEKADATDAGKVTVLHLLYGMLSLVHDYLEVQSGGKLGRGTDKDQSLAQVELYNILVPRAVRSLPPEVLQRTLEQNMAELEDQMLETQGSGSANRNNIPFHGELEKFLRGIVGYAVGDGNQVTRTLIGTMASSNNSKAKMDKTFFVAAETLGTLRSDLVETLKSVESVDLTTQDNSSIGDLFEERSPVLYNVYQSAMEIAGRANSPTVEPKHLVLAMLRDIKHTMGIEPKWATDAPDKVPTKIKTQEGMLQPIVARIALDALIPPQARGDLSTEKLLALAAKAEEDIEKLVYPTPPNVSDQPREPHISKSLADVFQSALMAPAGQYPRILGERLRKNLLNFKEIEDKALGIILKDLVGKDLYEIAATPDRASTPDEYKALLKKQFAQGAMSKEAFAEFDKKIFKLSKLSPQSAEYGVLERQLDHGLNEIQWRYDETRVDTLETKRILDEDHSGLDVVKQKILEHMAVMENQIKQGKKPSGKILCLVGAPGIGKTSLSTSLARATNRKLAHIALGGVSDEAEIRGHRSTYVGAKAGRISTGLATAGSQNPLFVLDEIDKLGEGGHKGDPSAALLEVLDPKQNHKFRDNYLEAPLDLSNAFFMVTANDLSKIPGPLRDRMEVIQLPAYDKEEKLTIAQKHMVGKIRDKIGLSELEFNLTAEGVNTIIEKYTMEAGVRNLEREIESLASKVNYELKQGKPLRPSIGADDVMELLGPAKVSVPKLKPAAVGRGNGLAVLGHIGGQLFPFVAGKRVQTQGSGMKNEPVEFAYAKGFPNLESGKMAVDSYYDVLEWMNTNVDLLSERYGFKADEYKGKRVLLSPQTNTKNGDYDGPSAGALKATIMTSVLTNRPVRNDVAMTGTMNAFGEVGPIGGLQQKIQGAMAVPGTRVVLFPQENFEGAEWRDISQRLKDKLELVTPEQLKQNPGMAVPEGKSIIVCPVERIEDVLDVSLLPAVAQAAAPAPVAFAGGLQNRARQVETRSALSLVG